MMDMILFLCRFDTDVAVLLGTMRAYLSVTQLILLGILFTEVTPTPFGKFSNPFSNGFTNMFCSDLDAPEYETEPLRYAPWMVVLSSLTEKGKHRIVNCGATLVSRSHALTSESCLRKEKTKNLQAIFGVPNLNELHKGTVRAVRNINILISNKKIAVLKFSSISFYYDVNPICLDGGDMTGIYATLGWENRKVIENGRRVAYMKMKNYCRIDGFCTDVLKAEEPWEMESADVQEGAPLMVKPSMDSYWSLKGIMIPCEDDHDAIDDEYEDEEETDINFKSGPDDVSIETTTLATNNENEENTTLATNNENEEKATQEIATEEKATTEKDKTENEDHEAHENKTQENTEINKEGHFLSLKELKQLYIVPEIPSEEEKEEEKVEEELEEEEEGEPDSSEESRSGKQTGRKRKAIQKSERKQSKFNRKHPKDKWNRLNYDLFFVKLTNEIVEELKEMFNFMP